MTGTRRFLGLSGTQMASLLGVHPMTYRKWESGARYPNAAAVKAFETYQWLKKNHPDTFNHYVKVKNI